ncbi:putative transmembrane protein [Toxoplasma gondii GAB2-2007-GAL-DOM2]|uniref:Putative transmembrane protein n=3 Tax=Toxoplasma gondii TaxID=5811 RepID=A0A086L9N8_TOXGO|nr:putative transmembrane protein [Toxoplasma gondii GAB2-2007-GAL-DOM2]KFG53356.1 putative transmembrane protein [Toxoplasma gondii FOU]RQX73729.1 putative transmembrane protein [Toxoplasma gondii CAST]
MRPLVLAACVAAVVIAFTQSVQCLSHVPKWVHDMRVQRVAELKEQIAKASESSASSFAGVDSNDIARLAEELACLQSEEDRLQDDKRSVALFATIVMVVVFLLFFLTTVHMDEAIKDASIFQSGRADLLDLRL